MNEPLRAWGAGCGGRWISATRSGNSGSFVRGSFLPRARSICAKYFSSSGDTNVIALCRIVGLERLSGRRRDDDRREVEPAADEHRANGGVE